MSVEMVHLQAMQAVQLAHDSNVMTVIEVILMIAALGLMVERMLRYGWLYSRKRGTRKYYERF